MSSGNMQCDVSKSSESLDLDEPLALTIEEQCTNIEEDNNTKSKNEDVLEKGRVWRRKNKSVSVRKTKGPVLRATLKPVKRFRPDCDPLVLVQSSPEDGSVSAVPTTPILSASTSAAVPDATTNSNNSTLGISELDNEVKLEDESSLLVDSRLSKQHSPIPTPTLPPEPPSAKKKRVRGEWSTEDKNHFFEAVALYGKDFEAIQKAIALKHRKRGDISVVKTKDQVRHLYYRTWTTVSKLLDNEGHTQSNSDKATQELSAVINYGKLRKTVGEDTFKKKGVEKLNELINFGSTSVKLKGKKYRVKTPACKALKKIIHKEEGVDVERKKAALAESRRAKVPRRLTLEIRPLTMKAWNYVHTLAHNPRIRFSIPSECHLSSVTNYLRKKWRPVSKKLYEVARHGQLLRKSSLLSTNKTKSVLENLQFHLAADMCVKCRITVHQVTSTKSHCIVSYTPHKVSYTCTARSSLMKKRRALMNTPPPPPAASPLFEPAAAVPVVDSGVSSDDEAAVTECLVSIENTPLLAESRKEKVDDEEVSPAAAGCSQVDEDDDESKDDPSMQDEEIGHNDDVSGASVEKITPTLPDDDGHVTDFPGSLVMSNVEPQGQENFLSEAKIVLEKLPVISPESTYEVDNTFSDTIENTLNLNGPKLPFDDSITPISTAINCDIETKDTPIAHHAKPCSSRSRLNRKKSLSVKNLNKMTLAELFIVLGKPPVLKLCYDWRSSSTATQTSPTAPSHDATKPLLPTGIAALVQAASLLQSKAATELALAAAQNSSGKPEGQYMKASQTEDTNRKSEDAKKKQEDARKKREDSKKKKDLISVGVQCTILEKDVTTQSSVATATTTKSTASNKKPANSTSNKKPHAHGRGQSKFATTSDLIDATFTVPTTPAARRRHIYNHRNNAALTQLGHQHHQRGGGGQKADQQFRKQMDAVNRRMDLFQKQRSSSRSKPYVVQRTMMPDQSAVRKFMTLTAQTSTAADGIGDTPHSSADVVGQPLGIKIRTAAAPATNVVAEAAEQAGVVPSTPHNNNNFTDSYAHAMSCDARVTPQAPDETCCDVMMRAVDDDEQEMLPEVEEDSRSVDLATLLRPPTPNVDSMLDSLSFSPDFCTELLISNNSNSGTSSRFADHLLHRQNTTDFLLRHSTADKLTLSPLVKAMDDSNPPLYLATSEQQSPAMIVSSSTTSCANRDNFRQGSGGDLSALNTPQRLWSSDNEDSMDNVLFLSTSSQRTKKIRASSGETSVMSLKISPPHCTDDLDIQHLFSENSVDLMSRFQELIQQTGAAALLEEGSSSSVRQNSPSLQCVQKTLHSNKKGDG